MTQLICTDYTFGTESGILSQSTVKDIKWKTMAHWDSSTYRIDCRIVETATANHSITYFGGSISTPSPVFSGSTLLFCNSLRATFAREQILQVAATWQEVFPAQNCSATPQSLSPNMPGDCCWGVGGYITNATYSEDIDLFQMTGPTGFDGSSENAPLLGSVIIKAKSKKTTLNIVSEKEISDPSSYEVSAAIGGCSYSISGGNVINVNINSQQAGFKTWTYQIEKIETFL